MWLVRLALRRPYTVAVMALLILVLYSFHYLLLNNFADSDNVKYAP